MVATGRAGDLILGLNCGGLTCVTETTVSIFLWSDKFSGSQNSRVCWEQNRAKFVEACDDFYSLNPGEPERLKDCEWDAAQRSVPAQSLDNLSHLNLDLFAGRESLPNLGLNSAAITASTNSLFSHEYGCHWVENKLFDDLSEKTAPLSQRLLPIKDPAEFSVSPGTFCLLLHPHEGGCLSSCFLHLLGESYTTS